MPRSRRIINTEDNMQYNNTKDTVIINPPHKSDSKDLKDIVIQCPKGYVIDTDNSKLTKGIIKFRKNLVTLADIHPINSMLVEQACGTTMTKIKAIATLMDIAKYYNGDWKPDWSTRSMKHYIYYTPYKPEKGYRVDSDSTNKVSNVYFKSREDAQAVIDNPNFRNILDTIYKN